MTLLRFFTAIFPTPLSTAIMISKSSFAIKQLIDAYPVSELSKKHCNGFKKAEPNDVAQSGLDELFKDLEVI